MSIQKYHKEFVSRYVMATRLELPELVSYEDKLRVSGFPFCGLKRMFELLTDAVEEEADEASNVSGMGKPYYTGVGTVAHSVFQRYMASGGDIIGDWKCYSCGTVRKGKTKKPCKKCGSEMEYEEFSVTAFDNVSGHLDGVWHSSDGKYFVIDYKTSSVKAIRAHRNSGDVFPYTKNVSQIEAYCAIIEKTHGIKISGWFLLYISRDHPLTHFEIVGDLVSDEKKARILRKVERFDKQYTITNTATKFKHIIPLIEEKPCKTFEFYSMFYKGFKGCPLEGICFSDHLRKFVENLWNDNHKEMIERRCSKCK